jgi:hypothetical protein
VGNPVIGSTMDTVEFYNNLLATAKTLSSDGGENPEYDRALVELIADSMGGGEGVRGTVAYLVLSDRSPLLNRQW